ncbi:MAG: hypothetical protein WA004_17270 [Saprospiraceae bacterium]
MTTKRLEHIIEEINLLEADELEKVLKALLKRIERKRHIESILDQYIGIGKGVWETDAQGYVNELRKEDTDSKPLNG